MGYSPKHWARPPELSWSRVVGHGWLREKMSIGWVFVGPRRVAAGSIHDLEDRVHTNKVVRIDWTAVVVRIARRVVGIDSATGIELLVIYINFFVKPHLCPNDSSSQES